jgi:ubiquinone/menaquinone biosynthesis C-methylase UbiE
MFKKSAEIYDQLYSFLDYSGASRKVADIVRTNDPDARTLLDVGCGTGLHLTHLAEEFEVMGVDISNELIAVARRKRPDIPYEIGDMADFSLGRTFDAVTCLFSSIGYVKTLARMRAAVAVFARHLNPGGILLVEPWFTPDAYWTGHITANFYDGPDMKIAWMYTSRRKGRVSVLDIHYMVGTPEAVDEFREVHEIGLFTREEYERAFRDAGLSVNFDAEGLFRRGLFMGVKG